MPYTPGHLDLIDGAGVARRLKGFWTSDDPPQFVSEHRPTTLTNLFSGELLLLAPVSFTRPANATPYAGAGSATTGDLVANNVTAGGVVPLEFDVPPIDAEDDTAAGWIASVKISTDGAAEKTLRLHLWSDLAPTVTNGDNGALAVSNHDQAKYLGFVDVDLYPGPGGAQGQNSLERVPYSHDAGTTIYGLLEARTAFTPANAGAIKVTIGALRGR